jgi:lipopolysaccharide/colanic/teichoic acid biosynthesis glycosyltransferase
MSIHTITPIVEQTVNQTINQLNRHIEQTYTPVNEKRFSHCGIPLLFQQFVSALGLLLISPLLLLVMLLIKLESPGNILFSQTRIGENGRHFKMYKFRSMYLKSDPRYQEPNPEESSRDGVCKKYVNDPRITTIGKFIRKYSIDELPQLFNVVTGDMCLVGPRPALAIETYEYEFSEQARLFSKPGLTGLWQVSGRANTSFAEQLVLDTSYIEHQSIVNDIKIILLTIPAVLTAKGAY